VSGPELPTRVRDLRMLFPALIGWATCCLGVWLRPGIGWLITIGAMAIVSVAVVWRAGRTPEDDPPLNVRLLAPVALALVLAWVMLAAVSLGEVFREQSAVAERAGSAVSAEVLLTQTFTPGMRSVDVTVLAVEGEALAGGGVAARLIGFPFTERVAYGSQALVAGYLQEASPWEEAGWVLMVRGAPEQITPPGGFLAGVDRLRLRVTGPCGGLFARSLSVGGSRVGADGAGCAGADHPTRWFSRRCGSASPRVSRAITWATRRWWQVTSRPRHWGHPRG